VSAWAAYDQQRFDECAREFQTVADSATSPIVIAKALYSTACCSARAGKPDAAFRALTLSLSLKIPAITDQLAEDEDLHSLHADPRWKAIAAEIATQQAARPPNPALRQELLERKEVDQAVRRQWAADFSNQTLQQAVVATDAENTAWLKQAIIDHGWPSKSLVGQDGAFAAFLMVQHADKDLAFQRQCLALMQQALPTGEVDAMNVAYLEDRIAVAEHRPQRYGTQFINDTTPFPIADPAHVDERRAAVGLGTLSEYKKAMQLQAWKQQ
ncbi:MAG TPA: hypothetical protein PLF40_30990, partial [Kofleriaceae bacterium]|nr:hypothetical protein [Kofleriaceae bacterium]